MIIETWFLPSWPKNVPSFLMMHAVNDETGIYLDHGAPIGDNNYIRPSELEGFIRYAQHKGYHFSTFREAIEHPRPYTMAMTFDDGYVDNWTNLLPLLQRLQIPATCFVTNLGLSDPAPPNIPSNSNAPLLSDALAPETFMGRHYLLFYAIICPLNKNVLVSTFPTALVALEIDWRVGITSVEYGDSIQERVF